MADFQELKGEFKKAIERFIAKDFEASLKIFSQLLEKVEDPKDKKFLEGFYEVVEGTKYIEVLKIDLGYQSLRSGYLKLKSFYPVYKGVSLSAFLASVEESLVELRGFIK
jgi:hypothetical protein